MTRGIAGLGGIAGLARLGVRTATAVAIIAWVLLLRPTSLGGPVEYLVIRGDSMLPTYVTGDLVIVREANEYGVGDIAAYRVPAGEVGSGRVVIHRIVGREAASATAAGGFVLQGDNNPAPDPWRPGTADMVGRAWIVIPAVGRLLSLLHQPAVLGAGAASVMVVLWFLRGAARPAQAPAGMPDGVSWRWAGARGGTPGWRPRHTASSDRRL